MHRIICSCSFQDASIIAAAFGREAEVVQHEIRGHSRYRLEGDVSCDTFEESLSAIRAAGGEHLRTVMLTPIKEP